MKKITKLMLTLALCVLGVGSANAERQNLSLKCEGYCNATWNSSTKEFTWGNREGREAWMSDDWVFMAISGLSGNLSQYTKMVFKLEDFTNVKDNKLILYFKENKGNTQSMDYVTSAELVPDADGMVEIDLTTFDWTNDDPSKGTIDKTNIADVTIYGSDRTDDSQSGSVKVTQAYIEKPDAPFVSTKGGFGEEVTSLADITDGTSFVIGDGGTNVLYWVTSSVDNQEADVKSVPNDSYFCFKLENVAGLDLDGNGEEDTDNYRIKIVNTSGSAFTHAWNLGSYLNYSMWGHLFAGSGKSTEEGGEHNYGGDDDYYAIWKVAYTEGKGFTLKNAGINKYAKVKGTSDAVVYLKFYKSIVYTNTTLYPANDEIFALSKATGYDAETGTMTNGTWTFETPVDLSNWKYIIIAMEDGCANADHEIQIKDNDGNTIKGDDYTGTDAGTGQNLWFSRWHHQNIGAISLNYLLNNGIDIHNLKSLSIAGTIKPFVVYLSCYDNTKLVNIDRWTLYKAGDLAREYSATGKFGTICLPYKASVAGAEVYSIAGIDASSITLTKVNGLLEAGKPYFYMSADEIGQNNEKNVRNVNFFRADFDRYDVATPVTNNGLIGTFTSTTAPAGTNYLILSGNALYNTEGCIGDDAVTIGANKAYVDKTKIVSKGASARVFLPFGDVEEEEVTGIQTVKVAKNNGMIFNLNGQRMNKLNKGLNIIGGKKVMVK